MADTIRHEFELIGRKQIAPYFLTVHEIVEQARRMGILCQGRGSAANSAVCYCLGVTSVNPNETKVLFERFLSNERDEPPDIDVDFEHERREKVIQWIYNEKGRSRAALAATVIAYRSRSAIREVGKALGLSPDTVGAMADTVWGMGSGGVDVDHVREAGLDPADPRLMLALELSATLCGFPRHLSQHVGGFVLTEGRLDELVPIQNAAMEDRTVVEWDKDDLDALKIYKVDVLGLGMLTCLRKSFELIEKHYGETAAPSAWSRTIRTSTTCCARPIRSACSRSRAGRRCRCCRGSSPAGITTSSSRWRSCGPAPSRAAWSIPT